MLFRETGEIKAEMFNYEEQKRESTRQSQAQLWNELISSQAAQRILESKAGSLGSVLSARDLLPRQGIIDPTFLGVLVPPPWLFTRDFHCSIHGETIG